MSLLFIGFKIRNFFVGPNFGARVSLNCQQFQVKRDTSAFYCSKYTGRTLLEQLHRTCQEYLTYTARLIKPLVFFFKFAQLQNYVVTGDAPFWKDWIQMNQ